MLDGLYAERDLGHEVFLDALAQVVEAAPGVHPARAPRTAANIAKLPELLRRTSAIPPKDGVIGRRLVDS
jgi:hypothetical protein